jgi:hypothetical protein
MIHACRTVAVDDREAMPPTIAVGQIDTIGQLLDCRDALNSAAEELAASTAIAMAYPTALQKIDVTAQTLEKLASRLTGTS